MTNHTPTPWQISGVRAKAAISGVTTDGHHIGPDSDHVALVYYTDRTVDLHRETFGNAAFIVKAVNSHDALVNALQAALAIAKLEWFFPGAHPHRAAVVHDMEKALLGAVGNAQEPNR